MPTLYNGAYVRLGGASIQPLQYPKEAGLPVGGRNYSAYVMLEVHFNNPDVRTGT